MKKKKNPIEVKCPRYIVPYFLHRRVLVRPRAISMDLRSVNCAAGVGQPTYNVNDIYVT